MSGIAGILHTDKMPVAPSLLDKMVNAIRHRGPDGTGTWIDENIGLAQLQLNITPESYYEKLPYQNRDLVLVGDYRIDNRNELTALLGLHPDENGIIPDGRIILAAYRQWGESCAEKLYGDFIFVIWNKPKQTLYCARDVIGTKTLFCCRKNSSFLFASEIKALLATGLITRQWDENAVFDYLFFFSYDLKTSSCKEVQHLPPAHYMTITPDGTVIKRYWQLPERSPRYLHSDDEYAHALLEVFANAVTNRARTNQTTGVMLSGGLDSSAIACLLARKLADDGKNLYAASSVLSENHNGPEIDEREYIGTVIRQEKNIVAEYVEPPQRIFQEDLDREFDTTETPVNAFYYIDNRLIERLKAHNVRIIFNGIPGDAVISLPAQNVYTHLLADRQLPKLFTCARKQSQVEKRPVWMILAGRVILPLLSHFFSRIFGYNSLPFDGKGADAVVTHFCLNKTYLRRKDFTEKYTRGMQKRSIERSLRVLTDLKYLNNEIFKNFAMEEVHGKQGFYQFEYAFPFFDRKVFEFMNNIPADILLMDGWRRGFFRRAMTGILPPSVQWRTNKMPFSPANGQLVFNELTAMRHFYNRLEPSNVVWEIFDKTSILAAIAAAAQAPSQQRLKATMSISRIYVISRYLHHYFGKSQRDAMNTNFSIDGKRA